MMFFKVIIFITICAVDSRIILPELKSEQEIPVLRYNEHVVFPIIYKYAKYNQYTHSAPNSIMRSSRSAQPNPFQELQYAPLYEGMRWKSKKQRADEVNTQYRPTPTTAGGAMGTTEFIRDEKFVHIFRKSHLEPRPDATGAKCYAPGNKAEAATSVNRSPGHNVVYKIFPESIPTEPEREPIKLIDYVKPIGINLKLESLTTTIAPLVNLPSENVGRHLELSKQQFVISPIEYFVLNPNAIKNKRYLPHTKYHRLHLNIARVYSPGQLPQQRPPLRPPVRVREENLSRRRGGKYAQAYVPQAYKDLSLAHNTMLHPVKHHRKTYNLRTSIDVRK